MWKNKFKKLWRWIKDLFYKLHLKILTLKIRKNDPRTGKFMGYFYLISIWSASFIIISASGSFLKILNFLLLTIFFKLCSKAYWIFDATLTKKQRKRSFFVEDHVSGLIYNILPFVVIYNSCALIAADDNFWAIFYYSFKCFNNTWQA